MEEHTSDEDRAGRAVRVRYVPQGFGLALVIDEELIDEEPGGAGVLRVSDAVVTAEVPMPDGGWATLAWDPAEVTFDPLVA